MQLVTVGYSVEAMKARIECEVQDLRIEGLVDGVHSGPAKCKLN